MIVEDFFARMGDETELNRLTAQMLITTIYYEKVIVHDRKTNRKIRITFFVMILFKSFQFITNFYYQLLIY